MASLASIRPLDDGLYYIKSRQPIGGHIMYLSAPLGGDSVVLAENRPQEGWFLEYREENASYSINRYVSPFPALSDKIDPPGYVGYSVDRHTKGQHWAARINREEGGIISYSFTPLSQPDLTLSNPVSDNSHNEVLRSYPARLFSAPLNGKPLPLYQLWDVVQFEGKGGEAKVALAEIEQAKK